MTSDRGCVEIGFEDPCEDASTRFDSQVVLVDALVVSNKHFVP